MVNEYNEIPSFNDQEYETNNHLISQNPNPVVFVEDDMMAEVFNNIFQHKVAISPICKVTSDNSGGCEKVINYINNDQNEKHIGIIDADFYHIDEEFKQNRDNLIANNKRIFTLDTHDIETFIVNDKQMQDIDDDIIIRIIDILTNRSNSTSDIKQKIEEDVKFLKKQLYTYDLLRYVKDYNSDMGKFKLEGKDNTELDILSLSVDCEKKNVRILNNMYYKYFINTNDGVRFDYNCFICDLKKVSENNRPDNMKKRINEAISVARERFKNQKNQIYNGHDLVSFIVVLISNTESIYYNDIFLKTILKDSQQKSLFRKLKKQIESYMKQFYYPKYTFKYTSLYQDLKNNFDYINPRIEN